MQPIEFPQHDQPGQPAMAAKPSQTFPSLDAETRTHVETACAAFHLTRQPQTLRAWACLENGPLRPIRVMGRLAWPIADIKRLLNGDFK
jgi:hypothetical protein